MLTAWTGPRIAPASLLEPERRLVSAKARSRLVVVSVSAGPCTAGVRLLAVVSFDGSSQRRVCAACARDGAAAHSEGAGERIPERCFPAVGNMTGWSGSIVKGRAAMSEDVRVRVDGGLLTVSSPYNQEYVAAARRLGGRWDPRATVWRFDAREEQRVRDLLRQVYGTDGTSAVETVTVRVCAGQYAGERQIYVAGRVVARRLP